MKGHPMSDSTRRALRTAYQVLLAAIAVVAVVVVFVDDIRATFPQAAALVVTVAAAAGVATKLLTMLEAAFPSLAWLRSGDTYTLSESTRRALRTAYQTFVGSLGFAAAAAVFVPALAASNPALGAFLTAVIAGAAIVSKILNALENAGRIPAWIRGVPKAPAVEGGQ